MPVLHKAVNSHGLCNSTVRQLLQSKHSLGHEAWRVCCLLSCKAFYDLTEKDLLAILGKLLLDIWIQLSKIMVFLIQRWWIIRLWGAMLIVLEGMDLLAWWGVKLLSQKLKFVSWQLCWKKAVALSFVASVSISLGPRPYKICVKTFWIPWDSESQDLKSILHNSLKRQGNEQYLVLCIRIDNTCFLGHGSLLSLIPIQLFY